MNTRPIYVTQPSLGTINDLTGQLKDAWKSGILTHNGPLVQKLEKKLSDKLAVPNLSIVNNGTTALQIAIRALRLKGEIITTPFTWIATISAIKWENCIPIFCDIDPNTLNIDPKKIEPLITEKTVAIMPVHVFGTGCDIESIERIAKKYNLKVIYDAAHAVGTNFKGESILKYGDISATSFHATKIYNTAEGGACITTNQDIHKRIQRIRFFGHNDEKDVIEDGFNGKMTEIHAALGLINLELFDLVLNDRKAKYLYYKNKLSTDKNLKFQHIESSSSNYSYFPIIFDRESQLQLVERKLNENNIFPRRYFYPSVNTYTKILTYQPTPISENISKRILCLPLYYDLSLSDIDRIIKIIFNNI